MRPSDLLELGVGLLLGDLLLLDEAAELALGDLAGPSRGPVSTNSCSTSLSTTGTPAVAITWAISPPIVPAPTTAALNTNIGPFLWRPAEATYWSEEGVSCFWGSPPSSPGSDCDARSS